MLIAALPTLYPSPLTPHVTSHTLRLTFHVHFLTGSSPYGYDAALATLNELSIL
jgi:hypothetical protein